MTTKWGTPIKRQEWQHIDTVFSSCYTDAKDTDGNDFREALTRDDGCFKKTQGSAQLKSTHLTDGADEAGRWETASSGS